MTAPRARWRSPSSIRTAANAWPRSAPNPHRRSTHDHLVSDRRLPGRVPQRPRNRAEGTAEGSGRTGSRGTAGPGAAGCPAHGLGAAVGAADARRGHCPLRRTRPTGAGQPGTHHADHEPAGARPRYPGSALVLTPDRARPRSHPPAAASSTGRSARLAATTGALASAAKKELKESLPRTRLRGRIRLAQVKKLAVPKEVTAGMVQSASLCDASFLMSW